MNTDEINSWSKYKSWQSVTPPSRPAEWQINVCRNILLDKPKTSKIAVLGSTIEYRNLLAELGFKHIYIFERNKEFYDYITPFAKNELHEYLLLGNWLDTLKNYIEKFDIILSDLTSGNIPYSYRDAFYSIISASLTSKGMYVDRLLTKPLPFIDLSILIEKYTSLPITNKTVNSFNCEVLFCSTLLNNEIHVINTTKFYDYLLSLNIPRISEFVVACYEITPRDCVWWYSQDWDIEKRQYEIFFEIIDSLDEPDDSEYYSRVKFFISKKRRQRQ